MNQLLELSPLIAFFVVFELFGIYWASAALMVACVLVLVIHRRSTGQYKTMHVITAVLAVVLGGATLLFHDARFIQWKLTVLLGLAALAFLGSAFVGKQPLARRMLEGVFPEPLAVSTHAWLVLNALWATWFALLAGLNLYVAHNFPVNVWVHFKVIGITVLMIVFTIPQVFWLNGRAMGSASPGVATREQRLRARLEARFAPLELVIADESHLHAGHAGAAAGHGHFRIRIVAEAFRGLSPLARHRAVYAAVGDLMQTDIHALSLEAEAPAPTRA